jgi:hypothetical protein
MDQQKRSRIFKRGGRFNGYRYKLKMTGADTDLLQRFAK